MKRWGWILLLATSGSLGAEERSAAGDALVSAALRLDVGEVKALLERGVDANARSPTLPHSPLNAATLTGCGKGEERYAQSLEIVDVLLAAGANPNATEGAGTSTLTMAAQRCPGEVVQRLLDAGGDVAHRSPQGWGPLSMALMVRNKSSARVLIEHGARLPAATIEKVSKTPTDDPELQELLRRARQ